MNPRTLRIAKAILTTLDRVSPAQLVETIIHADAQTQLRNAGETAPSLSEFNVALVTADQRGWITGVSARVTGQMKWSLSDAGKAALLEM